MSSVKKSYSLGKVKQLIDLNGDSVNFDIQFQVISNGRKPFELTVVDQTTLDNNPVLTYEKVEKGEISGSITHDKNVYQNHFLVLRSDEPCQVEVTIDKKDLPKTIEPIIQPAESKAEVTMWDKVKLLDWNKIILVIIVAVILMILWKILCKPQPSKKIPSLGMMTPPPSVASDMVQMEPLIPMPSLVSNPLDNNIVNQHLAKLKSLDLS